jgi:nucleotide-binding universal stress UspA family protein
MNATPSAETGPVLIAYDGSDVAKGAIAEAGRQLGPGRDAVVITVWQPFNVGFLAPDDLALDARESEAVRKAAGEVAAAGASLANEAGFKAQSREANAAPSWKGIVESAEEHDASLIVMGSHGRSGLGSVLIGSVAEAVAAHSQRSVLIVH